MSLPTQRGYARMYLDAPIKFAISASDQYFNGFMRNCSAGGMYFLAELPVQTGAEILIRMVNRQTDGLLPADIEDHHAEVVW